MQDMFIHQEGKQKFLKSSLVQVMATVHALFVISKKFSQLVSVIFQELLDLRSSVLVVRKSIFLNVGLIMLMELALEPVSLMPF